MLIFSPLEQFQILNFLNFSICGFDFSITNSVIILTIGFLSFYLYLSSFISKNNSFYIISTRMQYVLEVLYVVVYSLLRDNVGVSGKKFFPFFFTFFLFILITNIIGLVPYSFTITSHLIVTFSLACTIFIGINIICIQKHGIKMLSLFLPSGSSLALALLLVPIEIVSYFFRPISLSVRLFANMMAGHTLLKVIISFAWIMLVVVGGNLLVPASIIPLLILVILMFLEFGVAMIQAYVFTILICIYLNDALHLH